MYLQVREICCDLYMKENALWEVVGLRVLTLQG